MMTDRNGERVDGRAEVSISQDEMEAWVILYGPEKGGSPIRIAQVLEALSSAEVTERIDQARIEEAIAKELWGMPILAARGTPCVDGQDAKIDYCFPLPEELQPLETEDGKIDFHNLNLIHNVKKGDVLAVRIPPVPGTRGRTVTGSIVQPRIPKDRGLLRGDNTKVDASGCTLIASTDGHATIMEGKVSVVPVYQVKHDVDFVGGNIDFVGSVQVHGDVRAGSAVKAGGDIEILGLIEAAHVVSGGSILVKNGITGKGHCTVTGKGDIIARYVEGANLEAGGNVMVEGGIMQSNVKAKGTIKVEGRKGNIIGGCLQAVDEISAKVIGSPLSVPTVLELGMAPEEREEYTKLLSQAEEKKKRIAYLESKIREYQEQSESKTKVPESLKRTIASHVTEHEALSKEIQELESRFQEIEAELQRAGKGRVKAHERVYPEVTITIGRTSLKVEEVITRSMFVLEEDRIEVKPVE